MIIKELFHGRTFDSRKLEEDDTMNLLLHVVAVFPLLIC